MKYKTRQEVLRAAADWMDICEMAGVTASCRWRGFTNCLDELIGFEYNPSEYEFPIALLEGKEVWVGSELYDSVGGLFVVSESDKDDDVDFSANGCSWNPPETKTVMVRLPVNMAKYYSTLQNQDTSVMREACKKALENLK